MTRPGIEPRSPGPLANTLTPRPIGANGFDCHCLDTWWDLGGIKCIRFNRRFDQIDGFIFVRKRKRGKKKRHSGDKSSDTSCFIKDIDYNGVSKWKGRKKKKREESSIVWSYWVKNALDFTTYIYIYIYPWWFLDDVVCASLSVNNLWKGMNPSLLRPPQR